MIPQIGVAANDCALSREETPAMPTRPKARNLHLSPSECHRRLLANNAPALAYAQGDVRQWQAKLRRKLRHLLGDLPEERCPLRPETLWKRDHPLGSIEKVVFTSEPHSDVPAYVCLPGGAQPPYAFMVCLQGHSTGMHNSIAVAQDDEQKPLAVVGDRDFAIHCMKRGIAALCIEQRSFGERAEKKQKHVAQGSGGKCHDAMMQALMLGRTLLGERVYDVDRGIDYLASRGDADMRRIGVMGNSGGGTATVYAAALLRRIAFAMPSCSFCTFRHSKMALHHCSCGYLPNLLKYAEMADIMGLFAPRPVVVVAGKDDPIIPLAGVREAFKQLKRIYAAAGAADRCHLVVGGEGHRFYAEAAWEAMKPEIMGGSKRRTTTGKGWPV